MKLAGEAQAEIVKLVLIGGAAVFGLWYLKNQVKAAAGNVVDAAGNVIANAGDAITGTAADIVTGIVPGGTSIGGGNADSMGGLIGQGVAVTIPGMGALDLAVKGFKKLFSGTQQRDTSSLQAYFRTYGYTDSTLSNARLSGWTEAEITTAAHGAGF